LSLEDPHAIASELVDHLDAMVAYWNGDRVCEFANPAYREWFGKDTHDVVGMTLEGLLGPLYSKNLPYIDAAYAGRKQVFERDIPSTDGTVRTGLVTCTPRWVDGVVKGIFVHVADVTPLKAIARELEAARKSAEHRATHDCLTGLPNRVVLMDGIQRAIRHAEAAHTMFALLSIDVDHFKRINDSQGHSGGDRFLVELAARFNAAIRSCDWVVRIAGDEFLILLPGIESITHVLNLADRIMAVAREPMALGGTTMLPSLSMGIALFPQHGATAVRLLESSDRALYAAKQRGRNCFTLARFEEVPDETGAHSRHRTGGAR
jgi:diguanylate cyclase (GGDEF)-like protein/PAS domain S-box-containing protein